MQAIVHAHPVALVAFSIVDQVPSTRVFHQAWRICGSGAFAPYRLPGSAELGEAIAAALGATHSCVILENHGVVTVGADLAEAFQRFETFEFAGKSIIKARLLGGTVRELSDEDLEVAGERLPEPDAFTPQAPSAAEQEVRTTLAGLRPPRLPPAALHQHARHVLRARRHGVLRDHAPRQRPRRAGAFGSRPG